MSGLGISYPPPTENVPIFDAKNFIQDTTPLTATTGAKYFLSFPNAQGTEVLQTTYVEGILTADSNLVAKQNIILDGVANTNYIEFPDGSKQYGAIPLINPSPAGTYTSPSSIVVNSTGQITSASSGTGGGGLVQVNTYTTSGTITPPANTYKFDIMIFGSGGLAGASNAFGSYFVNGGSGGSGNMAYATGILWKPSLNLTLSNSNGSANYTNVSFPLATGVVNASVYNGGNGGDGLSSGTGQAGSAPTGTNNLPTGLASWFQYAGLAGQTGSSYGFPTGFPIPPTTIGASVYGIYTAGYIGAGQSYSAGDFGTQGGWGGSQYTAGGCIITWYKTS